MNSLRENYLRLLEPWLNSALEDIYTPPERPDLQCYGSGYNAWGVQTNQKALAAFAVVGTDPLLDEDNAGMDKNVIIEHALKLLRFSLASHIEGDFHCTDGESWGHTWISALGIERMMHAVDELWEVMTEKDHEQLKKVLLSECNWLVDEYYRGDASEPGTVKAGLTEHNHPENNLWNGILLLRIAMMYPDTPRAEDYRLQGLKFVLNGISVPSDKDSTEIFDGKPLSEWHVGPNFFPSYSLNHHAYLNFGYMVICLSQVAMAHFAWKKRGLKAPEAVYLHVNDLWSTVRKTVFPDGRLARIGGEKRARYCYCQDYAIPTWLLMLDRYGEDCTTFEKEWLKIVEHEVNLNGDSSFLSTRLNPMSQISPTYYTRLESDRAAALSMGLCWRRQRNGLQGTEIKSNPILDARQCSWSDQYHGATFVRGKKRMASWTWRASEPPQGTCLPVDRSDMGEWRCNLSAAILGMGERNRAQVISHGHDMFDGGFINYGVCKIFTERQLAEGVSDRYVATQIIAFAALPDDATVVCIQYATAINRAFIRSVKGINLLMPNDIFNNGKRYYRGGKGEIVIKGPSDKKEIIELGSPWVTVDGCLTLKDLDNVNLKIYRPGHRQIFLRDKPFDVGSLHADEICNTCHTELRSYDPGEIIIDTAFSLRVNERQNIDAAAASCAPQGHVIRREGLRGAVVSGIDGKSYMLVLNTKDTNIEAELEVPVALQALNLASGKALRMDRGKLKKMMEPNSALLLLLGN